MLSSKWRRSPSHDKCSRRFCGSSRNYGRSHHPRQHEAFDCHAFKRNRQEECVQMPVKIARSTPRPSFGLRELLVASHISRLASRDAAKSLPSTLVSESSGECRLKSQAVLFRASHHSAQLEIELTPNIPFVKYGGLKFLEAAHVKDVLTILRWCENRRDRVAGFWAVQCQIR